MNRLELMQAGRAMFGPNWKGPTAAFLNVNRRTISRWIAADQVPEGAAQDLRNSPALRLIQRAKEWRAALRDFDGPEVDDLTEAEKTRALDRLGAVVDEAEDALIAAVDELESKFPEQVAELVDVHLNGGTAHV